MDYLSRHGVRKKVLLQVHFMDGKAFLPDVPLITAHIGGATVDIPSNIDQVFLSKIFKSLKECV